MKLFAVAVLANKDNYTQPTASVIKIGEWPPPGPRTPSRVLSLLGPDRELFLKGRQCEARGYGLGAYAYYRRVVENQKDRLIREIIRGAKKAEAGKDVVARLEAARAEQRFSQSLETVKDVLPKALYIDGHNPMALLHSALSEELHAGSDDAALKRARAIRQVLAALVEKIGDVTKQHAGLRAAMAELFGRKEESESSPSLTDE